MKFKTNAKQLLEVLTRASLFINKRSYQQHLKAVEIEARENKITIRATNLDLYYQESLDVFDVEEGITLVSCEQLINIIKSSKVKKLTPITCNLIDGKFHTNIDNITSELTNFLDKELPNRTLKISKELTLDTKEFFKLLNNTKEFQSDEESRRYIKGLYLETTSNDATTQVLRGVATNGHILALHDMKISHNNELQKGVIIPDYCINNLYKILAKSNNPTITLQLNEHEITFKIDNISLYSSLIDATYPNYSKVIPSYSDNTLTANTQEFYELVNLYNRFRKSCVLEFNIENNKAKVENVIFGCDDSIAIIKREIDMITTFKNKYAIRFDMRYLKIILDQIEEQEVTFGLNENSNPAVIKSANNIFVILPCRL